MLLERIEISDVEFNESLASINNVMKGISNAIQQSVGILAQAIRQPFDQEAGCCPQNYYQNIYQTINTQREEEQRNYYNL